MGNRLQLEMIGQFLPFIFEKSLKQVTTYMHGKKKTAQFIAEVLCSSGSATVGSCNCVIPVEFFFPLWMEIDCCYLK